MRKVLKSVALSVPQVRRLQDDRLRLYGEVERLGQENDRLRERLWEEQSPFYHYRSTFDAEAVIRRHAVPDLVPTPGFVTNFLGVRIDPAFVPDALADKAGTVEPIPIPANWHADIAEWAAALRAVELAGDTFRMVELGCGWGCWMNNAGAAARRAGKAVHLTGIEGDPGHVAFAHAALATNGFRADEVHVVHGIAGPARGTALWPRQSEPGGAWDLAPVLGASAAEVAEAEATGAYDVLDVVGLDELVGDVGPLDLLHVDIQGGEADLVDGCAALLAERVRYLLIGTHSRPIEGRLHARLVGDGWRLEIERPAILALDRDQPAVLIDGVQGWRNPVR
jgi:hypothetical protein